MDEHQLEIATIKLQDLVIELLDDGMSPMAVAGIIQASATKMYRVMLDDKEFEELMGTVIKSSKQLHNDTLH
jgi:hypothetical protein